MSTKAASRMVPGLDLVSANLLVEPFTEESGARMNHMDQVSCTLVAVRFLSADLRRALCVAPLRYTATLPITLVKLK